MRFPSKYVNSSLLSPKPKTMKSVLFQTGQPWHVWHQCTVDTGYTLVTCTATITGETGGGMGYVCRSVNEMCSSGKKDVFIYTVIFIPCLFIHKDALLLWK